MKLSIIIPVYNERDTISEVLKQIDAIDLPLEKEIIILDGCSTDGTKEILRGLEYKNIKVIFESERLGKGYAVRRGFKEATGDIFLIQDADLELDPKEYPNLLKPILDGETEVVFGSRFLNGRGNTRIGSLLGNKVVAWFVNMLYFSRLTDIGTCYKVFKATVIKTMKFDCNSFDFDAEITVKILKKGFKISEIPIGYNPRTKDQGKKLHWLIGIKILLICLKYRFIE